MKWIYLGLLLAILYSSAKSGTVKRDAEESLEAEEARVKQWMGELNKELIMMANREAIASWNYASNITDATQKIMNDVSAEIALERKVKEPQHFKKIKSRLTDTFFYIRNWPRNS